MGSKWSRITTELIVRTFNCTAHPDNIWDLFFPSLRENLFFTTRAKNRLGSFNRFEIQFINLLHLRRIQSTKQQQENWSITFVATKEVLCITCPSLSRCRTLCSVWTKPLMPMTNVYLMSCNARLTRLDFRLCLDEQIPLCESCLSLHLLIH